MMIFLTAILIIVAFVIGVLVGRILKMSFGCSGQDSQRQATAEPAASSAVNVSSANLVSSDSDVVAEDQVKTTVAKSPATKAKAKTASSAAKKKTASKMTDAKSTQTTATKTRATAAKKATPASKAKSTTASKSASVKSAAPAKATGTKPATVKKAAPKKAAPKTADKKPSAPDDLKLIKGVGKLIETKLAKEGITTYSQIAAWKKADITEFDERLSFKGRIDRDEWIKQAKVLAKGGTTEFSKRAAKGKVPSSS